MRTQSNESGFTNWKIRAIAHRDRSAHRWAPLPHHRTYGSRIRRFGWQSKQQTNVTANHLSGYFSECRYQCFTYRCNAAIRYSVFHPLPFIPTIRLGPPFRPLPVWDLPALGFTGLVSLANMPSADFHCTVSLPWGLLTRWYNCRRVPRLWFPLFSELGSLTVRTRFSINAGGIW